MLTLEAVSPDGVARGIAGRARQRRLEADLTQQGLARRAGLSLSTYRRFEATGEVSVHNLVRVALALGAEDGFEGLFGRRGYASLDEVIAGAGPTRRRGRRNA